MPNLNLKDVYRATDVNRWGIVKVARNQSIAEHSFQVAMIASRICDLLGEHQCFKDNVVWRALTHDLTEVLTGDLASPLKPLLGDEAQARLKSFEQSITILGLPQAQGESKAQQVVKAADLIEAIAFLDQNAMTSHGEWVKCKLLDDLHERFAAPIGRPAAHNLWRAVTQATEEVREGQETTLDHLGELAQHG